MIPFDVAARELEAATERLADRCRQLQSYVWVRGGRYEGSRRHAMQILSVCWARRARAERTRDPETEATLATEMRDAADTADRAVQMIDETIRSTELPHVGR